MHIRTKARGYQPLSPRECVPAGDHNAHRYTGPIPSFGFLAFIRDAEKAHLEWVERRAAMVADRAPKRRRAA